MSRRDWRVVVDEASNVMRLVHLAGRKDPFDVEEMRGRLLKRRQQLYEDELAVQAGRVGCPNRRGRLTTGPSLKALVPGPLYLGMKYGRVVRFEEITRAPHEVQDTLLSALSDKVMIIPELPGDEGVVLAQRGFSIIATANTRDRGVNEMSSALKRRFNFETVAPISDLGEEIRVVREQVTGLLKGGPAEDTTFDDAVLELLVTTFHEVREGRTSEGVKLEKASSVMSTAEAVSVGYHSALYASFFAKGTVEPAHLAINLAGAVAKDNADDMKVLRSYWDVAVKHRARKEVGQWKAYFAARKHLG